MPSVQKRMECLSKLIFLPELDHVNRCATSDTDRASQSKLKTLTQPKIQKNIILTVQNSILKNAVRLYDKLIDMINVFVNKDIYSRDVKRDMRYKSEESKPEFEESITKEQK